MKTRSTLSLLAICLLCCAVSCSTAIAAPPPETPASDSILLTIFLRHDESKTLAEIQQLQAARGQRGLGVDGK